MDSELHAPELDAADIACLAGLDELATLDAADEALLAGLSDLADVDTRLPSPADDDDGASVFYGSDSCASQSPAHKDCPAADGFGLSDAASSQPDAAAAPPTAPTPTPSVDAALLSCLDGLDDAVDAAIAQPLKRARGRPPKHTLDFIKLQRETGKWSNNYGGYRHGVKGRKYSTYSTPL